MDGTRKSIKGGTQREKENMEKSSTREMKGREWKWRIKRIQKDKVSTVIAPHLIILEQLRRRKSKI